jgi:hypothetical protein
MSRSDVMAEASSKTFKPREADTPLKIEQVELHRIFETDEAGLTSIHVWITAAATPRDERFQSLTADVAFVLSESDAELGTLRSPALCFDKAEVLPVEADQGLRLALSADVTCISARIDVVKVVHATAEQTFDRD